MNHLVEEAKILLQGREAMDNAVKAENYELAMKLKEEIDSRHTTDNEKHE